VSSQSFSTGTRVPVPGTWYLVPGTWYVPYGRGRFRASRPRTGTRGRGQDFSSFFVQYSTFNMCRWCGKTDPIDPILACLLSVRGISSASGSGRRCPSVPSVGRQIMNSLCPSSSSEQDWKKRTCLQVYVAYQSCYVRYLVCTSTTKKAKASLLLPGT
jgi:hypothetical protein